MKKQLSRSERSSVFVEWVIAAIIVMVAMSLIYFVIRTRTQRIQREIVAREELVQKTWQEYMAKDPNEEELWNLATTQRYRPKRLIKFAARAFIKRTSSKERLIHLLSFYDYDEKIRVEVADRLLQDPSIEALKSIIDKVPERVDLAVSILAHQARDPNIIGYKCFLDIITNAPNHRKWAWENVLSRPDWITIDIGYCFSADPNFPDAAADVYFKLCSEPEDYRRIINIDRLRSRAWKEFILTKPKNKEISTILYWSDVYPTEIKIPVAKYLLANNPSEDDLNLVEEKCPSLKEEVQKGWKKFRERKVIEEKEKIETKEDILKKLENLLWD